LDNTSTKKLGKKVNQNKMNHEQDKDGRKKNRKKERKSHVSKARKKKAIRTGIEKKNKNSYSKKCKYISGKKWVETEAWKTKKWGKRSTKWSSKAKKCKKKCKKNNGNRPYKKYTRTRTRHGGVSVYTRQYKHKHGKRNKQTNSVQSQCKRERVRATLRRIYVQKRETLSKQIRHKGWRLLQSNNVCRYKKRCYKYGNLIADISDYIMSEPSPMDLDNVESFPVLGTKKGNSGRALLSNVYVVEIGINSATRYNRYGE
jgi:hypothetical protein